MIEGIIGFLHNLVIGFVEGCIGTIGEDSSDGGDSPEDGVSFEPFELTNCEFQIGEPIDADLDGRQLGMCVNFPKNSGEISDLNGIAYLVDRDHDGKIDAIQIDCRDRSASSSVPAKITEFINVDTLINNADSCSPQAKELLNQLVTHSLRNGGDTFAKAIPDNLLQKGRA